MGFTPKKTGNEYAAALGATYDAIPKAVLAAVAVSARLLIVASVALLAACTNQGTVNWAVVQTTEPPSAGPSSGMTAPSPAPLPTGPDGKDYVPYCLPSDPPGSYCQPAPQ